MLARRTRRGTLALAAILTVAGLAPVAGARADDLCPPVSAVAPKYEAPARIKAGPFYPEDGSEPNEYDANEPPSDKFLFRFSGARVGERAQTTYGYRTIDALANEVYPQGFEGFRYRMSDPFSGINLWFSVVPSTERIDSFGGGADGLFLRRIEVPRSGAGPREAPLEFIPASSQTTGGLRMLDFPIEPGDAFDDGSVEIAAKDPVRGTGIPLWRQSANVITSSVKVGNLTTIAVCDQLARGWKVAMEVRSTGEYRWTMIGNFVLGTHIGGWPLKDDVQFFSEDGKLISGSFSSNLARVDPGDYL